MVTPPDLQTLDQDLETFRRHFRTSVRRATREALGQVVGGPAFHLLEVLLTSGPQAPSHLAEHLAVRTSTMASHLNRLEEMGWIRRGETSGGGGRIRVFVTPTGAEAHRLYVGIRRRVLEELLGDVPEEVLAAWTTVFHQVMTHVRPRGAALGEGS